MEIRLSLHNIVYPRSPVFCGYKIGNKEFTMWDTFIIEGDMTLQEFLDLFKEKYEIEIDTVTYGNFMVYGLIINKKKIDSRLKLNIKDIIETELEIKLNTNQITLQICTDIENEDSNMELPEVLYLL